MIDGNAVMAFPSRRLWETERIWKERRKRKMRENERNNRNLAVGGIIGGVLMMLANIIIHMGTTGKTPDPGWIDMPGMLPGITEILAVLAAAGLLAGWVSLYRMVRESWVLKNG